MLLYDDGIIFVELKERNHQWLEGGMEQLKKTIAAFVLSHGMTAYRHRRAYVANSKKPNFQSGHQRFIDKFYSETEVVLFVQARIDLAPLL